MTETSDTPVLFTATLAAVGRADLDTAGGKGANLGELVRAGFKVPPGFVITTAAYRRFIDENQLAVPDAAADPGRVRAAFEAGRVPSDLEEAIRAEYRSLGDGPVAVRSSATAEDLPGAAFAGQQDTFLNIRGGDALIDAVRRCWASLWTDRAVAYRARLGIEPASVSLAVVVQRLVDADAAGVMFTANPVSGDRSNIVIDANPGLGEAVVAGLVTPEHVVLRRGLLGWRIVERRAGRREVVVRAAANGGTEQHTARDTATPTLPDEALRELATLGRRVERHFGGPQDIEWAWADGRVFLVQARPMTALPEPSSAAGPGAQILAGLITEFFPERPYPLEATTWAPTVFRFLETFLGSLGLKVRGFETLFHEDDGVIATLRPHAPIDPTPSAILAPIRLIRLARRTQPHRYEDDPELADVERRVEALKRRDLAAASWPELLAILDEALAIPDAMWTLRLRHLPRPMFAVARLRLVLQGLGRADEFGALAFTGVETQTMAMNRGLRALAARVRAEPALADAFAAHPPAELRPVVERLPSGPAFLAEFDAFLDTFGHRETGGTLQLLPPPWADAPDVVLGLVGSLAGSAPRSEPARQPWEVARDRVLRHPLLRVGTFRRAFLRLLATARRFAQLRENTRFTFMLPLPIVRRAVFELGERLGNVGALDTREDVLHLRLDELRAVTTWPPTPEKAAALHATMVRRRARRAELASTPLIDPQLRRRESSDADVLVHGMPGSPGVAEGPVRIVRDAAAFPSLQPGEVLVAPFTNPAWTPLFERAIAVVVDSGGPASHAAIVAREYGIPAVMGTVEATSRLTDGQHVRVDGSAGVVTERQAPPEN